MIFCVCYEIIPRDVFSNLFLCSWTNFLLCAATWLYMQLLCSVIFRSLLEQSLIYICQIFVNLNGMIYWYCCWIYYVFLRIIFVFHWIIILRFHLLQRILIELFICTCLEKITISLQYTSANSNTQSTNIFVRINRNWGKIRIFAKYKRNVFFTG